MPKATKLPAKGAASKATTKPNGERSRNAAKAEGSARTVYATKAIAALSHDPVALKNDALERTVPNYTRNHGAVTFRASHWAYVDSQRGLLIP